MNKQRDLETLVFVCLVVYSFVDLLLLLLLLLLLFYESKHKEKCYSYILNRVNHLAKSIRRLHTGSGFEKLAQDHKRDQQSTCFEELVAFDRDASRLCDDLHT